jgi:NAD(P)-dependent dehydrogenase (short-subunit alcohol dehydrogenase family)
VSDQTQVDAALDLVEREMGAPSVLIHNAVGGAWGTFMEVDPATLNRNFQVNTMGLLYLIFSAMVSHQGLAFIPGLFCYIMSCGSQFKIEIYLINNLWDKSVVK